MKKYTTKICKVKKSKHVGKRHPHSGEYTIKEKTVRFRRGWK